MFKLITLNTDAKNQSRAGTYFQPRNFMSDPQLTPKQQGPLGRLE